MNDWVAYYPEFTGYPDEVQVNQHKMRRTVWKRRINAFCAEFLGSRMGNNNKKPTTVPKPRSGNPTPKAPTPAPAVDVVVQNNVAPPRVSVEQLSRAFEVTNHLLYPTDPNVELDQREILEIAGTLKVS